ncbi:MAG TPA: PAS domain-containing protein [Terriglobales bacterium]|nr:PAS domain-containing protein [Terriglobales bacterium]
MLNTRYAIVDVNEAYLAATMTTREQLIARNIFEMFPKNPAEANADGPQNLRASLDRARLHKRADKMPVQRYDIARRKAGDDFEERYWSPINIPIIDSAGTVTHIMHRVQDVTAAVKLTGAISGQTSQDRGHLQKSDRSMEMLAEFVRKERDVAGALRESQQQLTTLVDSIPQLAWMANADGWIFWYNRRWYEYTGTTPEQMEGWGWQSVHDPKELPLVLEKWRTSIATGQAFEMSFPLLSAAGEFRWFLTRVFPLKDENGKVLRWFGTNTDVNELRRTQQRLRSSEERLRIAQQAAGIGSWELESDNDEFHWSEEAYKILGMTALNRRPTFNDLLNLMYFSADRETAKSALKAARQKKKGFNINFRIQRPTEAEPRWISARGSSFYNQGESLILGVFIDVTETLTGQNARK